MNPVNLLCKYEGEMMALRKFATKFPGYGNLSKLPSGTAQLQQIHRLVDAKLWVEQNPDRDDIQLLWLVRYLPTGGWNMYLVSISSHSLFTRTTKISCHSLQCYRQDRSVRTSVRPKGGRWRRSVQTLDDC